MLIQFSDFNYSHTEPLIAAFKPARPQREQERPAGGVVLAGAPLDLRRFFPYSCSIRLQSPHDNVDVTDTTITAWEPELLWALVQETGSVKVHRVPLLVVLPSVLHLPALNGSFSPLKNAALEAAYGKGPDAELESHWRGPWPMRNVDMRSCGANAHHCATAGDYRKWFLAQADGFEAEFKARLSARLAAKSALEVNPDETITPKARARK